MFNGQVNRMQKVLTAWKLILLRLLARLIVLKQKLIEF